MEKKHTSSHGKKMTRAQAGKLGGKAHHTCRGRECSSKNASKNHSKKSHASSSRKSSYNWF